MPGNVEFFGSGQGAGVFRLVVGGHEIGNDEEDALRDFVFGVLVLPVFVLVFVLVGISLVLGVRRRLAEQYCIIPERFRFGNGAHPVLSEACRQLSRTGEKKE